MRLSIAAFAAFSLMVAAAAAQPPAGKSLDMYFVDTEGGLAVVYVMPSGQTIMMDTGNPGDRDHDRIMAVLEAAHVKKIDHLVLTHYHGDHVGGLEALAKKVPIAHFIDHGPTVEEREQVPGFQKTYAGLYAKATRTIAKPGDRIPVPDVNVTVVTSAGKVIQKPLPGGGEPNPYCAEFKPRDESKIDPDNPNSVGLVFTYGKFRTINLGDFTWNAEKELMCPNNPIGTVDLFLTSHHGIDQSNSPALVHALHPRVVVMQNGQRKGGTVQTMTTLRTSPGLEDLWQLHWAWSSGIEYNSPGVFIANMDDAAALASVITNPPTPPTFGSGGRGPGGPPAGAGRAPGGGGRGGHTGPAFWIRVSAHADGSFTVLNTRNNFSKTYSATK